MLRAGSTQGITICYCYAREDQMLRDELEKHLAVLKQLGHITTWHSRDIPAGTQWRQEMAFHLQMANIILLLVSPDFLASEDAYHAEMKQALERHMYGQVRVIPILLRPVDWEGTLISRLQALPVNGIAVTKWPDRDDAFRDIARGIRQSVNDLLVPLSPLPDRASSEDTANEYTTGADDTQAEMEGTYQVNQSVFLFNAPLTDIHEFYGRRNERMRILDRIYKRASTSIIGPRRIGKTWLLQYIRLIAPTELGSRFRVAYLDATSPQCMTIAGFMSTVLEELNVRGLHSVLSTSGLSYLESVVKTMRANNCTPVLCIDEFEGIINERAFDLRFFTGLRAIAQAGLVLVVASKHPLMDLVSGTLQTSPFFNIFEQLTLGPFSTKEAEMFVKAKSLQAHFTDEEQSRLLLYGHLDKQQWSPIWLQLVGALLLENKILAEREDPAGLYRPGDPDYWQRFQERVEEIYREVVR